MPLTPSSISSTAALYKQERLHSACRVGPLLDNNWSPVALAPRGRRHACRARPINSSTVSVVTNPGTVTASSIPHSRTRRSTSAGILGPSPTIAARTSGNCVRSLTIAGTIAGTHFSAMWRPANKTRGSAAAAGRASSGPSYAPASTHTSPRRPSSVSRAAYNVRSRTHAEGRARTSVVRASRYRRRLVRDTRANTLGSRPRTSPPGDGIATAAVKLRPLAARSTEMSRYRPRRTDDRGGADATERRPQKR